MTHQTIDSGEPPSGRGDRLTDRLRGRGDVQMSTDEIMSLTRELTEQPSTTLVDSDVLLDDALRPGEVRLDQSPHSAARRAERDPNWRYRGTG